VICYPFPNITNEKLYAKYNIALKSLIYYFIPLCIIAGFYVLMAIRLHASANEMPGEVRGAQSVAQAKARRHVARMVLIFVFCKSLEVTVSDMCCSKSKYKHVRNPIKFDGCTGRLPEKVAYKRQPSLAPDKRNSKLRV
jgi:hypothetical protein